MICSCVQFVQVFADVILTHKFHLGQLVYTPILVLLELPGFHLFWGNTRARSMEISHTHFLTMLHELHVLCSITIM